ncbi:MAG: hypothetical protein ACP5O6_04765 [Candidatus Baltobacteraceae bacterium]
MKHLLAMTALLACAFSAAAAAPTVPGRAQLKGAMVGMNQQFHITGFNYRIHAIRWVAASDPFAQAIVSYVATATAPNGYLVFEVPVKNTQSGEAGVPGLDITAFYKDGTEATSNETPFSKTGSPLTPNNLFPGQGMTVYYAIVNVPRPTKANPLVKLLLRYTANNDPGYPPVYRMLHPVVTP